LRSFKVDCYFGSDFFISDFARLRWYSRNSWKACDASINFCFSLWLSKPIISPFVLPLTSCGWSFE
jgi:hypothetical protein